MLFERSDAFWRSALNLCSDMLFLSSSSFNVLLAIYKATFGTHLFARFFSTYSGHNSFTIHSPFVLSPSNFISHNSFLPTVGQNSQESGGHSLNRLLVRSHRSLIRLLRTARFARALRCAHSFARLLTHSLPSLWESV